MRKLLITALFLALNTDAQALNSKATNFKMGQFCGDDCDGSCKEPKEKPEKN